MESFQTRFNELLLSQTKDQLSKECGISRRLVNYYLRGEKSPTLENLIALADFFDVSLDYLTGRSDDPRRDGGSLGAVPGEFEE